MNPEIAIFGFILIIALGVFLISHYLNKMNKLKSLTGDKSVLKMRAFHEALHEINNSDSIEEAYARVEDLIDEEKENITPRSPRS